MRNGLRLFHAAQTTQDEIVQFTLAAAALEVLTEADETPLLASLDDAEQRWLRTVSTCLTVELDRYALP